MSSGKLFSLDKCSIHRHVLRTAGLNEEMHVQSKVLKVGYNNS
ncbi:hypothetical protein J2X61_003028 [Bacillus sp. 3255]|nr:hypothetical protein [Bacillus sp. 3255]